MKTSPRHSSSFVLHCLVVFAGLLPTVGHAGPAAVTPTVEEAARAPYAIKSAQIDVTVGRTVSRVVATYDFIYVRVYDSSDRLDPMLIDVPVIVRADEVAAGKVIQLARAELAIGRHAYLPRDVVLLDHEAYEPVPWLPDGARIALVSFNVPRQKLKPRFMARVSYDQPHVPGVDGAELCGVVPLLPDYAQLEGVLHFQRDDFLVTFRALPDVQLRRDSINAHVVTETPENLAVHPLHRESIVVAVEPR